MNNELAVLGRPVIFWQPKGIQTVKIGKLTQSFHNPGVPLARAPKHWAAGGVPRGKESEVREWSIVMARLEREATKMIAASQMGDSGTEGSVTEDGAPVAPKPQVEHEVSEPEVSGATEENSE